MHFEQAAMTDDRIRLDSGIDALDLTPTDILDEETFERKALTQNAPKLEIVMQLLNQPALAVGREHDPFFEYLFPDVADQMELPDLDESDGVPAKSGSHE